MVLLKALGISNRFSIDFDRLCASMKGIDFGIDSLGQLAVDVSSHVLNKSLYFCEKNPQVVVLERDAHKAFQPLHPYQNLNFWCRWRSYGHRDLFHAIVHS